jgi:hypothetical protein
MYEGHTLCTACGRPCGAITYDDGRCESCGPEPLTPDEQAWLDEDAEVARLRREARWG